MSSSRKKVILRKFSRDWFAGYLPPTTFVRKGQVELLDLSGKVITLPLDDLKWICFVRDFNSGDPGNPERLLRKSFAGRPRSEGVWMRLRLKDNDTIEGLAPNDLTLLLGDGLLLTPPDTRSNTQRIFIPRSSISDSEIVSVISSPARRKTQQASAQEDLFSTVDQPESSQR